MKKILSMIVVMVICVSSIVGCGKKSDETSGSENEVLRVGMDLKFPPFSYLDDEGKAAGFEPVIAEAFAKYLGMEVEIVNTDFSMLIPALETGDVDVLIADMSETKERAQKADFSNPYRYTYTLALVNSEFAKVNGITDDMTEEAFFAIDGAKFVGLSGTKGVYYPQSYGVDVTEVTEIGTGLLEVSNGISDVLVASNEVHGFHAADEEHTMVYSGMKEQTASCFVVAKGNGEMLEASNAFIETMYEEGGLYDQIREEYDAIVAEFLQNEELGLDYITMPTK